MLCSNDHNFVVVDRDAVVRVVCVGRGLGASPPGLGCFGGVRLQPLSGEVMGGRVRCSPIGWLFVKARSVSMLLLACLASGLRGRRRWCAR